VISLSCWLSAIVALSVLHKLGQVMRARRGKFRTEIKTYLGQGLSELPFLARLAVDLRLVVVRADHDL